MAKVGQPLIDIENSDGASSASSDAPAASSNAKPAAAHAAHDSGDVFNEITTKYGAKLKVLATPAVRRILPHVLHRRLFPCPCRQTLSLTTLLPA
jgi:pyruvate/2-oxoglutarate dehydrogenase complex dihydrolipoamide acyltransferase (E2) component